MSSSEQPVATTSASRWGKRAVAVVVAVAMVALVWSIWDREAVLAWVREARPLPFFVAMALLPCIGVPFTPLFLLAGATFGNYVGLLGSAFALAANLIISYRIAQGRLRPHLARWLRRFDYEIPSYQAGGRDAIRFTLLTKLAPGIPGVVKTYGLGIAGVPFTLYFAAGMVVTGAYAVALVIAGDSLLEHDLGRVSVAVALVVVVALGIWWWRRRHAPPASTVSQPT